MRPSDEDGAAAEVAALRRAATSLAEHEAVPHPGGAAVLATVVPVGAEVFFLFERRPQGPSRFAGHLSFPGGRIEADDPSALHAALREAHEEIGFAPKDVDVLGHVVDTHDPLGRPVTCYLGQVPLAAVPAQAASPDEVDEIILVSLADLRGESVPASAQPPRHAYRVVGYESRMLPSQERIVQYWRLQSAHGPDHATLWGFTAGLVALLLNRTHGWAPREPPRIVARWDDLRP